MAKGDQPSLLDRLLRQSRSDEDSPDDTVVVDDAGSDDTVVVDDAGSDDTVVVDDAGSDDTVALDDSIDEGTTGDQVDSGGPELEQVGGYRAEWQPRDSLVDRLRVVEDEPGLEQVGGYRAEWNGPSSAHDLQFGIGAVQPTSPWAHDAADQRVDASNDPWGPGPHDIPIGGSDLDGPTDIPIGGSDLDGPTEVPIVPPEPDPEPPGDPEPALGDNTPAPDEPADDLDPIG